jgi:hypothetical protein
MKKKHLIIGIILALIVFNPINYGYYGYFRSKLIGMPYGITLINRNKLGIPEIPNNWERYPKENKLAAVQIWLNKDTIVPRHYAKVICLADTWKKSCSLKSFRFLVCESDRYVLEMDSLSQTDLVIRINYDTLKIKKAFKTCELVKINKLDTNYYNVNWFKVKEVIKNMSYNDAINLLKEKKLL